jgi:hypothetical protein
LTPFRLIRLAAGLGFVAFITACIIPVAGPQPVYGPPPGVYAPPTTTAGGPAGGPIEAGCSYTGAQLPGDVGGQFQIACPPGCESAGGLWGSDVYTADSAICRAGIHAGVITPAGGIMSVQLEPGRPAYRGSMRNGVASNDYGAYHKSYVVIAGGAPPAPPGYPPGQPGYPPAQPGYPPGPYGYPPASPAAPVIEAGCSFNAAQIQDGLGSMHLVACPPGCGDGGGLWGTDVYTADSAICKAAIHAGLVTGAGGTVAVILEPGRPAYRGSLRNAVQSSDYGGYTKSFRLQRP